VSKIHRYQGFEITKRIDGCYAVWDYAWWPDEILDADPEANRRWLEATEGWRAKGWIQVHVAPDLKRAHDWAYKMSKRS
jgi:hypothetical protein